MKEKAFDAVIFDLGGVIINIDYERTINEFKKLGSIHFIEMYSQASQSGVFDLFETGKISSQRFINELLPYLNQGTSPNKVVAAWNAMILNVPEKKIELLERLRANMPIYLLSNTNEIHLQAVNRQWSKVSDYPMHHYFNKVYLSHEIHLRKPTKEIFEYVCRDQTLDAGRTLFIDDSIQHIDGALSCGLQALHLKDPEDLYAVFS